MTYNPEFHHRRSIRLKGYDYSQAGAYFVTICSWNKECIFGHIRNHTMELNEFGEMVTKCWDAIPGHSPYAECDEFTVMPNHIHGIVTISNIVGADQSVCPDPSVCLGHFNKIKNKGEHIGSPLLIIIRRPPNASSYPPISGHPALLCLWNALRPPC
jgi:hypothetical protein